MELRQVYVPCACYGLISHCINYAEIKGENKVGGSIVGYNGAVNRNGYKRR